MDGDTKSFSHVVVIGASAGGIDALSNLLMTIPAGFAAPIVIAQHLDPSRPSHLRDILSRRSALPVHSVTDHEKLDAGVVYVVPSNRHARITDSEVVMRVDGLESPKPSVNLLLTTAASAFGDRLIAVILSGTGTDGAAGARVVKQAGGTVIIQNPETAAYPGMPLALAPTTVDIVADIDRIGPILQDLLAGIEVSDRSDEKKMLQTFLTNVREQQGLDFSSYKMPTILRRLQRRIVATDTESLQGYIHYVQRHPEEYQQLVNSFLIKVTEFFRDPDLYKVLRESVVPQLIEYARRHGNQLRIWSAGCATGEEAYSIAILLCEALGGALEHYNVRIFATDADLDAITFARRGVYPESALANLPPEYVDRYFTRDENGYHVKKRIRTLTVFGQHDLGQRAPFPHIDMAVCRNVLIYFTTELQQRTLHLFAYSLRDGGYLVLGKAETPGALSEYFHPVDSQHKVYTRHGERMPIPPARFTDSTPPPKPSFSSLRTSANLSTLREQHTVERARTPNETLVLQLPVGVIVLDRHYDIQTINSAARRMLSIYRPAIGEDLIHIVREMPSQHLRDAVDAVFRSGESIEIEEYAVEEVTDDAPRYLKLSCHPQRSEGEQGAVETVMIVVTDITGPVHQRRDLERRLSDAHEQLESFRDSADAQTATRDALVQRLIETNRQLVESNQELTSANEELRTANEEFLLTAEEAQAAVEEVETLNEELQATNEELETLNEELQSTIEELNTTNDDLHARSTELQEMARTSESDRTRLAAILSGMGDAVLVVASNGVPLLTNAAYDRMFGGTHASIPALDIDGHSLPPSELPQARAARGESFNMEFTLDSETGERRWFEANGQPIHDSESGQQQWSVLVIRDITERSLRRLQDDFIAMASHELRTPLTPLQTYLQMLQKQFAGQPPDAPTRHYTEAALAQVQRLARLVGDLLDVSRLQSGKYTFKSERIVLNQLVARAAEAAQTLAAGQTIRLDATSTSLPIHGDTDRLEQALLNILTNAITYAPGTEHIDVTLRRARYNAELRIRDYGSGIPATDLPQLFNRFYQAQRTDKASRLGLGLGLFIAREIVTAHGGDITAETQNGSGTTFTITLPLAQEKSR